MVAALGSMAIRTAAAASASRPGSSPRSSWDSPPGPDAAACPLSRAPAHRFIGRGGRAPALPVLAVFGGERRVADYQQVLGVAALGRGGEIEAAGDDDGAVDHHDLVMGDGDL